MGERRFAMFGRDLPEPDVMQQAIDCLAQLCRDGGSHIMEHADLRRDTPIPADGRWEEFSDARKSAEEKLGVNQPGWKPEILLSPREVAVLLLPRDGQARVAYTRDEFDAVLALGKIAAQGQVPITARDVALLCAFTEPSRIRWLLAHRLPGLQTGGVLGEKLRGLTENRNPTPEQTRQVLKLLK